MSFVRSRQIKSLRQNENAICDVTQTKFFEKQVENFHQTQFGGKLPIYFIVIHFFKQGCQSKFQTALETTAKNCIFNEDG